MSRAGFGEAKFGGAQFTKTGKVNPGENFIRILPPMHNLASAGTWKVYFTTHWGYKGVNPRDPSRGASRPFRCILDKDRRTGLIRQECPACNSYEELKNRAAEMEAGLKTRGLDKEEIKTAMATINQQLKDFRSESKYYVNVLYKDGKVGDFKLNHKDHMSRINAIIDGVDGKGGLLKTDEVNPLHPDQGVWFKLTRTGDGINPPDTVDIEYEDVDVGGRKLKAIKLAPLSDADCEKAQKECRSLDTLGGLSLTFDQILALTKCSGDPEEIDRIIGKGNREQSAPPAPSGSGTGSSSPPKQPEQPEQKAESQAPASKPADADYIVNGKVVSKEQFDRYTDIMTKKKADAELKRKVEETLALAAKKKAEDDARAAAAVALQQSANLAAQKNEGAQDGMPKLDPMADSDEDFLKSLGDTGASA